MNVACAGLISVSCSCRPRKLLRRLRDVVAMKTVLPQALVRQLDQIESVLRFPLKSDADGVVVHLTKGAEEGREFA